jgi:hypothetical protein
MRRRLITLAFTILVPIALCFGQNSTPVKISLRHLGSPQFPTGFWMSESDPHFRHRGDTLFWLSADKVATTFFKEYCCRSGHDHGERYAAAVFDLTGKPIATHQWTSMPDAPLHVGGTVGGFWVKYTDRVDILSDDFATVGHIPLIKSSKLIWSKSGLGVALHEETTISLYRLADLADVTRVAAPVGTRVIDVHGDSVLLNSLLARPCYVGVVQANSEHSWNVSSLTNETSTGCASGLALVSMDAVLVSGPGRSSRTVAHRNGTVEPIPVEGTLLGIANSGRMAFQSFRPNPLAEKLDLDFGGQKEVVVYDPLTKVTVFRTSIGGQSGAALSPDGRHLAVIDGHDLLIYTMPR